MILGVDWKPGVVDRKAEIDPAGVALLSLPLPFPQKLECVFQRTERFILWRSLQEKHTQAEFFFALEIRQIHSQFAATGSISFRHDCDQTEVYFEKGFCEDYYIS